MMTRAMALLLLVLTLAGCGSGDEPTVEGAETVAKQEAERFAAGDYGGAYDLLTQEAQDAITREDYIAFNEACASSGITPDVEEVRLEDDDTAVARLAIGSVTQSYTLEYQGSAWRWQPTDESMATYRLGLDAAIEQRKSEGGCTGE